MKTIKRLLLFTAAFCLMMACSKSDRFFGDDTMGVTLKKGHAEPVMVTVPFKSDFSVWDHSDYSDPSCGGYPVFFLTMKGNGTATHLGQLTTHMTFCCDVTTGYYYNTVGSFVAANGDELYISIPAGWIIPNEESNSGYYQTRFNDEFYFVGGTGRFEGASGGGWTHAYVHDADPADPDDIWHTDFFGTGTLTLVKGKQ